MTAFCAGQMVSHYRLAEQIGEGAMGIVWRACNTRLDCDVALKFIHPDHLQDETARRRIRKEARALSRIRHQNVATVHDLDEHDGADFLVMEYVPGVDLAEYLRRGPLAEPEISRLGTQIAAGLHAAHSEGVIHHDLKPGNVRIEPAGTLKILDFNLARLLARPTDRTAPLSQSEGPAGTLPYMSPEILCGEPASVRSDIYAAGVMLYEMATGRVPFAAVTSAGLIDAILHGEPLAPAAVRPGLSTPLQQVILKAIDREPELRYQSANELHIDLSRLRRSDAVVRTAPRPPRRRRLARPLAVLGTVAVVAATTAVATLRLRPGPKPPGAKLSALVDWPVAGLDPRITPDGQSASFIADHGDGPRIWIRGLRGGTPYALAAVAGNPTSHVWSPDGSQVAVLVVLEDRTVFVQQLSANGGPVRESRRLDPEFADAQLVRWCDAALYLAVDSSGLWSLGSDGSPPRLRLAAGGLRRDFDVGADGRGVVYSKRVDHGWQLWTSDADGGNEQALAAAGGDWVSPRWRGDACQSVVASHVADGQWDLWEIEPRNAHPERLTFSVESEFVQDVSRDGSVIALQQVERRSDLVEIDPHTAPVHDTRLTVEHAQALWPSAGRTGRRIAFQKAAVFDPGGFLLDSEIWTADLNGMQLHNLVPVAAGGGLPRLAPDASCVAYLRRGPLGTGAYELWVVDLPTQHSWCLSRRAAVPRFYPLPIDCVHPTFEWDARGRTLFWVEGLGPKGSRLCAASLPATAVDTLAASAPGSALSDVHPAADGRHLAYVLTQDDAGARSAVWVYDRLHRSARRLVGSTADWPGDTYCAGWIDSRSVLVLRTVLLRDWSERAQMVLARLDGSTQVLGELDRVFGGIALLDPRGSTLYIAGCDRELQAPNLTAVALPGGTQRRLTDNRVPTVSYSALQLLPNGQLVCALQEYRESVWFFRYGV